MGTDGAGKKSQNQDHLPFFFISNVKYLPPTLADDEDECLPLHFFAFFLCILRPFPVLQSLPQQSHVNVET